MKLSAADPLAPFAARLMRLIAERLGVTRFHPTAIAARGKLDRNQVQRWWNGERRIGDVANRDRLVAAFPWAQAEIDRAIDDDWKLHRRRMKDARRAREASAANGAELSDERAYLVAQAHALAHALTNKEAAEVGAYLEMLALSNPQEWRATLGLTAEAARRRAEAAGWTARVDP